jgi:hypothetical protein
MSSIKKPMLITSWILQVVVAFILGQTLFFKFTGAEETRALFEVLGAEPIGRYGSGVLELLAVVLLLIPRTSVFGAILSLGVITGAIGAHLTKLGISIDPVALGNPGLEPLEGPTLFGMAVVVFVSSIVIIAIRRSQLPFIGMNSSDKSA